MAEKIKGINSDLTGIATLTNDKLATYTVHGKPVRIKKGGRK